MTDSNLRPRIAVTMGDPAGVGPEICLRMLSDPGVLGRCVPIVFGDRSILARVSETIGIPFNADVITSNDWGGRARSISKPAVLDIRAIADAAVVTPGVVSALCGRAAFAYIERSIEAALAGEVHAVVTGPIHKEALRLAGENFPGHTEIYTERTNAKRSCMTLTCEQVTCSFATVHVGYHEVPGLLSKQRIIDVIELTVDFMRTLRGRSPKLVVCGLNPHAGEHGLFGQQEEERFIIPAIEAARAAGVEIEGPLPPDTAFLPARRKVTDAYICMYHDQGHIPLKMLAFDDAVNTTLGLPIIRTSVDHGTAFDIAWQGKANPNSLYEAIRIAATLAAPKRVQG